MSTVLRARGEHRSYRSEHFARAAAGTAGVAERAAGDERVRLAAITGSGEPAAPAGVGANGANHGEHAGLLIRGRHLRSLFERTGYRHRYGRTGFVDPLWNHITRWSDLPAR